jgi:hypothetical protein
MEHAAVAVTATSAMMITTFTAATTIMHFFARQFAVIVGVLRCETSVAAGVEFFAREHAVIIGVGLEHVEMAAPTWGVVACVLRQRETGDARDRRETSGSKQNLAHEILLPAVPDASATIADTQRALRPFVAVATKFV